MGEDFNIQEGRHAWNRIYNDTTRGDVIVDPTNYRDPDLGGVWNPQDYYKLTKARNIKRFE